MKIVQLFLMRNTSENSFFKETIETNNVIKENNYYICNGFRLFEDEINVIKKSEFVYEIYLIDPIEKVIKEKFKYMIDEMRKDIMEEINIYKELIIQLDNLKLEK